MGPPGTWRDQIDQMAALGYNTLRVPFSGDALQARRDRQQRRQATPTRTWSGLTPLQILDKVVAYAGTQGHAHHPGPAPADRAGQSALWYTPAASEST